MSDAAAPARRRAAAARAGLAALAAHRASLPVLACAATVVAFLARLFDPAVALATRDVPLFHLPLRAALVRLLAWGLPEWNPWLNGGQPLLSNPSYSFFYPGTWIGLPFTPEHALSLAVILHMVVAWAGAWRLARHLGAGRGGALLAALGIAAGGTFVSLLHALNLLVGVVWLPWALLWGDQALRRGPGPGWFRYAAGCGAVLALQLLNGEPATTLLTALALLCFALDAGLAGWTAARRALLRLAAATALAVGLAAVQIVPTAMRLADSPRAGGVRIDLATVWSTAPARLTEIALPRFFGNAGGENEELNFGWGVHDKDFPYLISIYPGALLLVVGLAGLVRGGTARRAAWLAAGGLGLFLALGRHNPLFALTWAVFPPLRLLRYPEKFLVLLVTALVFAGALGWDRLLAERDRGRRGAIDLPLALAGVLLAVALALAAALHLSPTLAAFWVTSHSGLPPPAETLAAGVDYLRRESLVAVLAALGAAALLWTMRFASLGRRALGVAAVALLGVDLWHYGAGLVHVVPRATYLEPPPLARAIPAPADRVFATATLDPRPEVYARADRGEAAVARTRLRRLDPYSGLLWGLSYAFNVDFELMLTSWAAHADRALREDWPDQDLARRELGAWNVGTLVVRRGPDELARAVLAGDLRPDPAVLQVNPFRLPRFRLVPEAEVHPDAARALAAARRERYAVARREHLVEAGVATTRSYAPDASLGTVEERGARVRIPFRSAAPALLVAAMTFDDGWSARLAGRPLATLPTALGQLAVELPPGSGEVELAFRDPWLRVGAALSGIAALALLAGSLRARRRAAPAGPDGEPLQSSLP